MKRLVLFDIDGTLLTTDGAAKRAFRRALVETYGVTGPIEEYDFSGKTDPQIARDLMRAAGLSDAAIDAKSRLLWSRYVEYLGPALADGRQDVRTLPGVPPLLDALDDRPGAAVCGLLTGNIRRGAELKLDAVDLAGRFSTGAFGSDCERRDDLPPVAVERVRTLTGRRFRGREIVVIGDTPHDVTCGRALGVRAVGVGTGRHTADALAEAGADAVLSDLADTQHALDILLSD